MAKRAFDKIKAGLGDARAHLEGNASERRIHDRRTPKKTRPVSAAEEKRIQRGIAADSDNPEWTAADFRRAKPFPELFPAYTPRRPARRKG